MIPKLKYGGEINKLRLGFCSDFVRHSAPRARPGDMESMDLSAYRVFRPLTFEFYAWVLTEDDRYGDHRM